VNRTILNYEKSVLIFDEECEEGESRMTDQIFLREVHLMNAVDKTNNLFHSR